MINSTKIIQYGQQIAFIGVNTLNTGFLTNEIRNSLSKEETSDIVQGTELIVHQIIGQIFLLIYFASEADSNNGILHFQ